MSDPRWITPEETRELMDRALYLLKLNGYRYEGSPGKMLAEAGLGHVQIILDINADVYVADSVANVLVFDHETCGIRELYGSTARNALLELRKHMVLDDVARA